MTGARANHRASRNVARYTNWVLAGLVFGCSQTPQPTTPGQQPGPTYVERADPGPAPTLEPTQAEQQQPQQPQLAVEPSASDVPRLPTAASEPLTVRPRQVIKAHPERAKTSGNDTHGSVGTLAFVGPDSQLIASGGNDDRVHVHDIRNGREVFVSRRQGKDVDHVIACNDGTIAAETYSGKVAVFTRAGDKIRQRNTYKGSMGSLVGWTDDCKYIVHAQFLAALELVDPQTGKVVQVLNNRGHRSYSLQHDQMLYPVGKQWMQWTYPGQGAIGRSEPVQIAAELAGAPIVQAHIVGDGKLVEYCQPGLCTVQLLDNAGGVRAEAAFDATHSVWVMTLGSFIELSPDQRYLFFYRDGLAPQVVELATGRRASLEVIPRTMSATVTAAFSPHEPGVLAVAMFPEPNKITVFEIAG